jgi:hypothetical protein
MPKDKNTELFELKISPELLGKMQYIADHEGRSLNNQFLMLARSCVDYYEKVHEKIKLGAEAPKQ